MEQRVSDLILFAVKTPTKPLYQRPEGILSLGKDEVGGSNPPSSSKTEATRQGGFLFWQAALRSRSLSP